MKGKTQAITELIADWQSGNQAARSTLLEQLYPDLRRLAASKFRNASAGSTLQPTALVNELLIRLMGSDVNIQDRSHFLALAAIGMRRILVDHARARRRIKRGGEQLRVTLTDGMVAAPDTTADMLDLDRALKKLAELDDRKARALELQYFAGLNLDEIGDVLDLSRATVARDLNTAKSWLAVELGHDA